MKGKEQGLCVIKKDDPLFGVVKEDHIGINPLACRPKILEKVLDGTRQYILVVDGVEKITRQGRIKVYLLELEIPLVRRLC